MSFGFIGRKSECECLCFEEAQYSRDNFFTCDVRFKQSSGVNYSEIKPGSRSVDRKAVNFVLKDELPGQKLKDNYFVRDHKAFMGENQKNPIL